MPGCWEHAFSLASAIETAKQTKRTLVGALIDIANAYGSVKHNLTLFALEHHGVPRWFQEIIREWYHNMAAVVQTEAFTTDPISMEVGVFQGDPLSVFIFLLVINPLFDWLSMPQVREHGFIVGSRKDPHHFIGTGFADDVSVVARTVAGAQTVLAGVERFMKWARLAVKVPKCVAFGIKKVDTRMQVFRPSLDYAGVPLPCLQEGGTFRFLGRDFFLTSEALEGKIKKKLSDLLAKISSLRILPNQKLRCLSIALPWTLSWDLSLYDLSTTFLRKLDRQVGKSVKEEIQVFRKGNPNVLSLLNPQPFRQSR